jgi:hypothetical protein
MHTWQYKLAVNILLHPLPDSFFGKFATAHRYFVFAKTHCSIVSLQMPKKQ